MNRHGKQAALVAIAATISTQKTLYLWPLKWDDGSRLDKPERKCYTLKRKSERRGRRDDDSRHGAKGIPVLSHPGLSGHGRLLLSEMYRHRPIGRLSEGKRYLLRGKRYRLFLSPKRQEEINMIVILKPHAEPDKVQSLLDGFAAKGLSPAYSHLYTVKSCGPTNPP